MGLVMCHLSYLVVVRSVCAVLNAYLRTTYWFVTIQLVTIQVQIIKLSYTKKEKRKKSNYRYKLLTIQHLHTGRPA